MPCCTPAETAAGRQRHLRATTDGIVDSALSAQLCSQEITVCDRHRQQKPQRQERAEMQRNAQPYATSRLSVYVLYARCVRFTSAECPTTHRAALNHRAPGPPVTSTTMPQLSNIPPRPAAGLAFFLYAVLVWYRRLQAVNVSARQVQRRAGV